MRYRDSPILAYKHNNRIFCRLCVLEPMLGDTVMFGMRCDDMECCSRGSRIRGKRKSPDFNFDNTSDKILISDGNCNICTEFKESCVNPCIYNIKDHIIDITEYVDSLERGVHR